MTYEIRRRSVVAVLTVMAMIATLFAATAPQADAAQENQGSGPSQQWSPCYQDIAAEFADLGVVYECTQVNVPLDWDRPNGPTIQLAVVRLPAKDQANYRGSLFLNPGGPGGSGVNFALGFGPFAPFVWGPVADQYDIVGFDPRGIARSTPLRCFGNERQAVQVFPPFPFPFTEDEVDLFIPGDQLFIDQCDQRGNKVLGHMSTANVARDMDHMRELFGNEKMNYVGISYGTFLGQTYANMFPENVGAFVIDAVLDPIAWSNLGANVPFSTSLRSDVGAQDTLDEFLRQCEAAESGACAMAPNAADRLDAVLETLRDGPILIVDPGSGQSFPYFYSFAVVDLLIGLYNPAGYADMAFFFSLIESAASPASIGLQWAEMQEAVGLVNKRGFPNYPNFVEGFPGVACVDTFNPDIGHQGWFDAGKAATQSFGIFGEAWTWASEPCILWEFEDEDSYTGPYDAVTANTVLVIGNFYDPATRYEGAQTARGLLPNSALLSVDEPGHASLGISGCAGFITGLYLEDPSIAAGLDGLTCPSEGNWFNKAAAAGGGSGMSYLFRTDLMDEMAFRP